MSPGDLKDSLLATAGMEDGDGDGDVLVTVGGNRSAEGVRLPASYTRANGVAEAKLTGEEVVAAQS